MTTRSEISKKAWRRRKYLGLFKSTCHFCKKPIWAKGVTHEGYPYHKGCLEAKMIGLKPEHIGRNPRRALRDGFRFYGAKALNPKSDRLIPYETIHRKSKGTCYYCHYPIYAGGSQYKGKRYHETCLLLHKQKVPSSVMANPGAAWHLDRAKRLHSRMVDSDPASRLTPSEKEATAIRKDENFLAADASKRLSIYNPRAKCPKCGGPLKIVR